jgi:nicotinamidase/pyrazinamidase
MEPLSPSKRTALIIVDVQNDFADRYGSLSVPDGAAVVPIINRAGVLVSAAGGRVYVTRDWHPEHTPHFAKDGGIWPDHCIAGTWGADLHPELQFRNPAVSKGIDGEDGYSGFSVHDGTGKERATVLDGWLREAGIEQVVVCGLATDYCVKATALDAVRLGYETALLLPGVRAVNLAPGDGDRALAEMAASGIAFIESIGAIPRAPKR